MLFIIGLKAQVQASFLSSFRNERFHGRKWMRAIFFHKIGT